MNNKIREMFEEVSAPNFGHELTFPRKENGEYENPVLEDHWQTFQEAVEATVKECQSMLSEDWITSEGLHAYWAINEHFGINDE